MQVEIKLTMGKKCQNVEKEACSFPTLWKCVSYFSREIKRGLTQKKPEVIINCTT